jgi:photosystem II stability/assembly factor-like uncharacterized protein
MPCTTTLRKVLRIGLLTLLIASQAGTVSAGTNVWTSNGPEGGWIQALAIDPATPATLYAGTFGGVFKSTNGGGAWGAVNTGLTSTYVYALAIDPATPSTLYSGTPGGVFKSANGGGNWGAVNTGLTSPSVIAVAIDPATPSTVYAGTEGGGVFKSTNGGGNWSAVNTGLPGGTVSALAIDPASPLTLYAGTRAGVFKSTDGGGAWGAVNTGLTSTSVRALAIDPGTPSTLYAGTGGGGVFAIQQVPALAVNYSSGAPGSYFAITGSNFPPVVTATIAINGNLLGTVPTDSSGGFVLSLETSPTTEEGLYSVTASVNPSAVTQFTLDAEDDIRPQEGTGTVFVVPDGIAYHYAVYLPLILR